MSSIIQGFFFTTFPFDENVRMSEISQNNFHDDTQVLVRDTHIEENLIGE